MDIVQLQATPEELPLLMGNGSLCHKRDNRELQPFCEREALLDGVLSALTENIVVIDDSGTIIAVNQAWERFASANGLAPRAVGAGVNYLQACWRAAASGDRLASEALVGIQEVLAGAKREYCQIYPCDSPEKARWFHMIVTPLADGSSGAVIAHVDVTERKQAEERLRESEERYRTLFETMAQGVVYQDASGSITDANPAAERILGLALDQMKGRSSMDPRWRAIWEDGSPVAQEALPSRVALQTGKPVHNMVLGAFNPARESYRWVLVNAIPQFRGDDKKPFQVYTTFEDITERVQRENELEAIASVALSLRGAGTLEAVEAVVLEQVTALLHAAGALLVVQGATAGEARVKLGHGQWTHATGLGPGASELNCKLIASGELYWTNDLAAEPCLARWGSLEPVRSVAAVPLVAQGQAPGVLWVGLERELVPADLRVLRALADIAASAMQRAHLHRETELRMQRLSALQDIDRVIISNLDLNVVLDFLLKQVVTQLGVDAATILTLDPHSLELEYAAGYGFRSRAITRSSMRLGQGTPGRAALERRTLTVVDLREVASRIERKFLVYDEGFVAAWAVPLVAKGQVAGVLELFHRAPLAPDREWMDFLQTLANQAAIALNNLALFDHLQRTNMELSLAYDVTIEGWSRALDLRDRETEGHSLRVTEMAIQLARATGMADEEIVHIRRGALLHDIGKMGIPDRILHKPGPLDAEEWDIMRRHPTYGYELLAPVDFLRPALDIPYCHHEKWDGSGYPRGLQGEQIPLAARVFAIVDVWDALTSDRPYRAAWSQEKALAYIQEQAGTHFEPRLVEQFVEMMELRRERNA
jgi:PAS domain S-box-containing protein/putative nucleotidyltransferase with HDIG domain